MTPRRTSGEPLTQRALNRALLARQGLLERRDSSIPEAVESLGAIQSQYWPAVPVALWSRMARLRIQDVYRAFEGRELLFGTLLRRTLHVVSAADHPAYAAQVEAFGINVWRSGGAAPSDELRALRQELVGYATPRPRRAEELIAFIETAVDRGHIKLAPAELAFQRSTRWHSIRSWTAMVRTPLDGDWGPRTPTGHAAAPSHPSAWPSPETAMACSVRRHLRAFGPAAAEDTAAWLGVRVLAVRQALDRLEPVLAGPDNRRGRPAVPRPCRRAQAGPRHRRSSAAAALVRQRAACLRAGAPDQDPAPHAS